MMGPNAITLLRELSCQIPLEPSMRVLDLGCGRGLTSAYLADTFGVQVFALDLWIPATENYLRFRELGLDSRIIPLHGDAWNMPFAEEYFDAVVSIDSYHYFGRDEKYMDSRLAPLVKRGGLIALALPGLKKELTGGLPPEMVLSWTEEDMETIRSAGWGAELLSKSREVELLSVREMDSFDECWADWLACDNSYAVGDRRAMEAGAGKYMNFISVVCRRK